MKQITKISLNILFTIGLAFIPYIPSADPPAQAIVTSQDFPAEITKLLNNEAALNGSLAGVSVRSAEDGEILYEHMGDTRLTPASVLKLFTAAAALSVLGEDYTFSTEILSDGKISGGTLDGDIYFKGKGDPTLLPEYIANIAKDLRGIGIKRVKGNLIADDTWYDNVRYSSDLNWNDEHEYYGAQISSLTVSPNKDYDSGTVIVNIDPGDESGRKGKISLKPSTDYVKIVNQIITVDKKGEKSLNIERIHGTNTILLKGTIPIESKTAKEWVAVWEPADYAASLLKSSLEKHGIEVVGKIKRGAAAENMNVLLKHDSMPLSSLLVPFMKLSNNGHAEVLIKEMGKVVKDEGSWEKGLEVMETELAKFNVNTERIVLRDGSGISHANLLPANEVTALLYSVQAQKWFPVFQHSLPVAGQSDRFVGGTMRNRLKAEPYSKNVLAKTGTLTGVSTLSGYAKTKSGKTLIFSVLLNNLMDEADGRIIEDKIAGFLASQP
ncbi:MAG TPA: D-alanyl-D-alanine carboxypeptidase/D-alanyl-D-alanine-endopeptidase [Bacillus bacterium]|nr:D-alanyl-D-alanine carboxypeptidase/D-alanyl-D-alanine-endopeptidase [Bacillus sp. (in: firmicutes)]